MKDQRWYQLYEAAVQELDNTRLKECIDAGGGCNSGACAGIAVQQG